MIESKLGSEEIYYLISGYGNFGKKRHQALGQKCLATVSQNPARGAMHKTASEIPKEIIEKCKAVVVTVPEPAKLSEVRYWLSRGKNVLVEKPLIITQEEADELLSVAKREGVIWYTAYNHRFEPHIIKIKELLEKDFLGQLYYAKLVYGFGNVRQTIGTWREKQSGGVVTDVGCHLIDLVFFLLGYDKFYPISLRKIESNTIDYCDFATIDSKILLQASSVTWKNQFTIEIFGEKGSVYMNGLSKWGTSDLIVRKRVFPAGKPEEKVFVENNQMFLDLTFIPEFKYFEERIKNGNTSYVDDLRMSKILQSILVKKL